MRTSSRGFEAALARGSGASAEMSPTRRNNVYGGVVNKASRISAISALGEVLLPDVVRGLARTSASVQFEDSGEQSLKGVGDAVRVWVVREGDR